MARRKSLRGLVLAAWLSLACAFASWGSPAVAVAADKPADTGALDILFLVDNSHSLNRFDPFNLRTDLVQALQQFYAGGPDRFAIADFGQKQLDFQAFKAEDFEKLVTQKLGKTNAFTSDPSVALAGPLAAAGARPGANPLWVVVISDGDVNVYDQANTAKPYIEAAYKAYSKEQVQANPGLISLEAERQMASNDGIKPFYAVKGTYTPVIFQEKAGAFYQALAGSAAQRAKPVVMSGLPLQDLFLGLVRSRPGAVAPSVFAYAGKKLEGGQKVTEKIQLPEGHKRSRLVFFGLGEKFSVRVLQGGNEKAAAGKTTGAEQHAVLNLETLPAGEYDLEIANTGRGQALLAEYALFLTIDANAEIAGTVRKSIGELPFNIALRNSAKKTLTDAGILRDLKATVTLQKAGDLNDKTASKEFDLSKAKESLADVLLPVATDTEPGEYIATVRFQSLKLKGGAYGLDLSASTKVKLTPVLEVNFTHDASAKHFVNESADLIAVLKKGKATEEKQTVTLANAQGGAPVKVVLTKNSQGAYAGTFPAERAGAWTIQAEFSETLAIGPGNNPTFMATPFSLLAQTPLTKQIYVQEGYVPVFTSPDFKKLSGKDPENALVLTLTPAAGAAGKDVTLQLTLDKAQYTKDARVKYDVTGGNRIADAGQYAQPAGYVGNTYTLVAPLEVEVLVRKFTLQYKKADGSWADASETAPAKVTLKLPWNEKWPESPADQKRWMEDKFNNQLALKATVSLGLRGPGEPEKATLSLVAIENKYSKVAMEAGANKDGLYRFQAVDGKNVISGVVDNPYAAPQAGDVTMRMQPGQAIKFDGELCTYAAKINVDGVDLAQQPQFDIVIEAPDKAWKQFLELLPIILIVVLVVGLIIWWVSIPRFKEHQIRPLRKGQPLNTVHMLVSMKVGATGREAIATPEAPNCIKFRRINATTTRVTSINEKVFVFVGSDKVAGWKDVKHGDELVVDGAGVFQRYRYFERQPTEAELKAAGASALDEDSDIIVEGL